VVTGRGNEKVLGGHVDRKGGDEKSSSTRCVGLKGWSSAVRWWRLDGRFLRRESEDRLFIFVSTFTGEVMLALVMLD
jgi:hypothetical protein